MGENYAGKMGLKDYPKRGEIYLVSLDPTVGSEISKTRPALVISNDINNQFAETVTVIPITSGLEKVYPFETLLSSGEGGLTKKSKAKCNQVRTISKIRLVRFIGQLDISRLNEIEKALLIHLGMNSDKI